MLKKILTSLILFAGTSYASSISNWTVSGTDSAGGAIDALATFTFSGGVLTVQLENLIVNQTDVGQAITGMSFDLAGLTNKPTETGTATTETVASNGSTTTHSNVSLSSWSASTSLTDVTVTDIGRGQSKQSILGAPGAGGVYTNANASITGNGSNAFTDQIATFTFGTLKGVNSNANIGSLLSNVSIGFGTAGNDYLTAVDPPSAPEPSTISLFVAGLAFVIWIGRRYRRPA